MTAPTLVIQNVGRRLRPSGPRPLPGRAHSPNATVARARQRRPLARPRAGPAGRDRGVHHRYAGRGGRGRPHPDDRPVRGRGRLDRARQRARRPALADAPRPVRRRRAAGGADAPRRVDRPRGRRDPRHVRRACARDPLRLGDPRLAAPLGARGALRPAHGRGHPAERRRRGPRGPHRRAGLCRRRAGRGARRPAPCATSSPARGSSSTTAACSRSRAWTTRGSCTRRSG